MTTFTTQNPDGTTKTVQHINYVGPRTLRQTIEGNKMDLILDFQDGRGGQAITIEKGDDYYMWVDHQMAIRRKITSGAEWIRWEYELPYSIVPQLEAMESGECDQEVKMNWDAMREYYEKYQEPLLKQKPKNGAPGSNVTPKKKKRK